MAQRNTANFKTLYGSSGTVFPDNTTRQISESDLRAFGEDIADSYLNKSDDTYIISATVDISSAQLLASNTTPITIVAAPGAGKILDPISITFKLIYNSVAYSGGNTMFFAYNNSSDFIHTGVLNINTAGTFYEKININEQFQWGTADIENSPIYLYSQSGNPTTGNSTARVYITYRVITV